MTALLTRAFHKLTTELSESEQNRFAQWLLDHDSRTLLTDTIYSIAHYNVSTQRAIQEAENREQVHRYTSVNALFDKLGL
jgi:hypothetical protein